LEALRVKDLCKDFGGVQAVRNVCLSVAVGEHLAIIGPNGAGKTTFFNVISGQLAASAGQVYLFGKDITHLAVYQRAHLGMARSFQHTSVFPTLTVFENILLALQATQRHRSNMFHSATAYEYLNAKASELLSSMDIWKNKDDKVNSISYGEQRKLEIAMSLSSEPKLLLMDEPSTGLTTTESAEIVKLIRNLSTDIAVILVAHDMDLVFGVAERIVVLHYGEIIAEGTPEEISANSKVKEIYMGDKKAGHWK